MAQSTAPRRIRIVSGGIAFGSGGPKLKEVTLAGSAHVETKKPGPLSVVDRRRFGQPGLPTPLERGPTSQPDTP